MTFDPTKDNLGAPALTSPTANGRDRWQEYFSRLQAVPSSKVVQAADALRDFSGSWAAQYQNGPSIQDNASTPNTQIPAGDLVKVSNLGRAGMPEINFTPFAHGTNRIGNKGGALIGSPISFSIVGPTLKCGRHLNWQWSVIDNSGSPNGDVLLLYTSLLSPTAAFFPVLTGGIEERYGFSDLTDFDGGLYLIISETGNPGDLTDAAAPVEGGIGDGASLGVGGLTPITPNDAFAKYEIFRVTDVNPATGLVLDPNKRIADYFTFGAGPNHTIRAITLFRPAATRLLAIPDSGDTVGGEQVFMFASPERALADDQGYPYEGQNDAGTADGWTSSVFQEHSYTDPVYTSNGAFDPYTGYEFSLMPRLPIPRPLSNGTGRIPNSTDVAITDAGPGRMNVYSTDTSPDAGQIIHITEAVLAEGAVLKPQGAPARKASLESLLGWFEVVRTEYPAANWFVVRRINENNPQTGIAYWGVPLLLRSANANGINLNFTLHDPVSTLWRSTSNNSFDIDKVGSARITNLIDPNWVGRSVKEGVFGSSPQRADKAIFNTESSNAGVAGSNSNPGSLLDLGFRVVLYPAKSKTITIPDPYPGAHIADPEWADTQTIDVLVPDWDRPITSNEALIDSTKPEEKQYIEVDYANGFVRLSHTPSATGGDLSPKTDISSHDDNPRGEMVLFASCVPYTQEKSQVGIGNRVTVGQDPYKDMPGSDPFVPTAVEQVDAFGERVVFPLIAQAITSGVTQGGTGAEIVLSGLVADQLSPSGFLEIMEAKAGGDPIFETAEHRGSVFGYNCMTEVAGNTHLQMTFGGGLSGVDVQAVEDYVPYVAVLRRDLLLPSSLTGEAGLPYQYDTSYGDAKRNSAIRFAEGEASPNIDGTTTLDINGRKLTQLKELWNDIYSSVLLSGAEVSTQTVGGVPAIAHESGFYVYQGRRKELPAGVTAWPVGSATYYFYIDGATATVLSTTALPLSDEDDILLAKGVVTIGAPNSAVWTDLRNPLVDIDKRVDIFVGKTENPHGPEFDVPHFDNLAAAVKYANNLQNPDNGDPDRRIRIRVIGYTEEADADLPIEIGMDGLIIEGSPRVGASDADKVELRWSHDTESLIDINGHHGLVFRDLGFRWVSTNPATIDVNTTPIRSVFTNNGGGANNPSNNIVIQNCRATGNMQGFIGILNGGYFQDSTIINNVGTDMLDYGILLRAEDAGGPVFTKACENTVIENNRFEQDASPGSMINPVTGEGNAAGILIHGYDAGVPSRIPFNAGDSGTVVVTGAACTIVQSGDPTTAFVVPLGNTANFSRAGNIITISYAALPPIAITTGEEIEVIPDAGGTAVIHVGADSLTFDATGEVGLIKLNASDVGTVWGNYIWYSNQGLSSIYLNVNNRIIHNSTEGFHVGIWSDIMWHSHVSDNDVQDTNTAGIFLAHSGGNEVSKNTLSGIHLSASSLLPIEDGSLPGIRVDGQFDKILGNYVVMGQTGALVRDIDVPLNGWAHIEENVVGLRIHALGGDISIRGNFAPNINVGISYAKIEGNFASAITCIWNSPYAKVTNNVVTTVTWTGTSEDTLIQGNTIGGILTVNSLCFRNNISDNRMDTLALTADTCIIKGNYVLSAATIDAADCVVESNTSGPSVSWSFTANSERSIITGNKMPQLLSLGESSTITGNHIIGIILNAGTGFMRVSGENSNVTGNTVTLAAAIGGSGRIEVNADGCVLNGNRLDENLEFDNAIVTGVVSGNFIDGVILRLGLLPILPDDPQDIIVVANKVTSIFTVGSDNIRIENNGT